MKKSEIKQLIKEVIREVSSQSTEDRSNFASLLKGKTIIESSMEGEYHLHLTFSDGSKVTIDGQGGYDGELQITPS